MGGYYTFVQVESVLDQIHAAYPTLTTAKFSIGTTGQGRTLWALKISDNPETDEAEPEMRFDAMHHAREPESMQCVLWMALALLERYGTDPLSTYLVNEREIWIVPCMNPDGYVYNQSTNPAAAACGARTGATTATAPSAST
jgi:murein tripeptide amidase MpaA